jgi:hypothetical protein
MSIDPSLFPVSYRITSTVATVLVVIAGAPRERWKGLKGIGVAGSGRYAPARGKIGDGQSLASRQIS